MINVFNFSETKPLELEEETFLSESGEIYKDIPINYGLQCPVCNGAGYNIEEFYERERCEQCCGTGDEYYYIDYNGGYLPVSTFFIDFEDLLYEFPIDSNIYHSKTNAYYNVHVDIRGNVNPFHTLGDYNKDNYFKPKRK